MNKPHILVAPLNWGLGHATRCVPIIHQLLSQEYQVILASDGIALQYLTSEFPQLTSFQLASLEIVYAKRKSWQAFNMLSQIPKLYRFIAKDQMALEKIIQKHTIDGIISDCRPGVFYKGIPSVYVNHQLTVKSGITTQISSYLHQELMKNFNEIWVPDKSAKPNLSGDLGHLTKANHLPRIHYLNWLSRLQPMKSSLDYDYCALISGPEPQRSLFQKEVEKLYMKLPGKKICITGLPQNEYIRDEITFKGILNTVALNKVLSQSKKVICRSGYTSLMDLIKLQKPALLVPTPGQPEQEYLATHMEKLEWFSVCSQTELEKEGSAKLHQINTNALPCFEETKLDFSVFESNSKS